MKIKYITEDGILFLKNNKEIVYRNVVCGNKSIYDIWGDYSYVKETPYEIDEIILDVGERGKESLTDVENIQRIYGHMKALSDSQASDERIWVAYTLLIQLEYMKRRWNVENEEGMLHRYFFANTNQRSLFRNGISRLWWIGRVTYDEKRGDPYELTKFICKNQDFIEAICGRNIFNNFNVFKAVVEAMYEANKQGIEMSRELIRETAKYVNLLAGTYIIDFMDYKTLYDKVMKYIKGYKGDK